MFTPEQEAELRNLHFKYVNATRQNYPTTPISSFSEVVSNVEKGAAENEKDLYGLIKSVLESMVYTSETDIEERMKAAEEDYSRRYETMTPEQQRVCNQYRLPY